MILAIFWTLDTIIAIVFIAIALFIAIYLLMKHIFNVLFKKDCSKCKHYYLHSVTGAGGGATYKCHIDKNRTIRKHIDSPYIFCKKYERT